MAGRVALVVEGQSVEGRRAGDADPAGFPPSAGLPIEPILTKSAAPRVIFTGWLSATTLTVLPALLPVVTLSTPKEPVLLTLIVSTPPWPLTLVVTPFAVSLMLIVLLPLLFALNVKLTRPVDRRSGC